jgi:hypothetical protein
MITFEVDTHEVMHDLTKVEYALSGAGMSAFLGSNIGPWLQHRAQDRFLDEGDSASGKWAPLTPATQEVRENMGYPRSHPINKRTGELEDYVTGSSWLVLPTPTGAMLTYPGGGQTKKGRIRDKVRTAQKGSPSGKTPPRPVLAVDETDLMFLMTRMRFHFEDPIGMAMGLGRTA